MSLPFFSVDHGIQVRRMPTDAVPVAFFEGTVPTRREAARISRAGYGLHLLYVPESERDLRCLEMFEGLMHLEVTSNGVDLRRVAQLTALRKLSLNVINAISTDLTTLAQLTDFDGTLEGNESVLSCPDLSRASFNDFQGSALPPIPDRLRELTLAGARRVRTLTVGSGAPTLEQFHLVGSRKFDLGSLSPFARLSAVSFAGVAHLENAHALVRLPLSSIGLIRCRAIEPVEALADLSSGTSVTVVGRLGSTLADVATRSDATWDFLKSA